MKKPDPAFSGAALAAELFENLCVPAGTRFKLAYSGGLDSHVLLHALASLRDRHDFSLSAIYIDHGAQTAAAQWGLHCAQRCAELDVAFTCERVEIHGASTQGFEAAARHARYAALRKALAAGDILLTAHHRNDQAETVLLQLLRGTGVAGLAAMPPRARFGEGELLRPLLRFTRRSLQNYANIHDLRWVEDPSNHELRLRRNYVRAEILPRLAKLWPEADGMLARTASHAAEGLELLDEVGAQDLERCRRSAPYCPQALSIAQLNQLTPAHQRNLLGYWLRQQGLRVPGTRTLNEVLRQIRHVPRSQHACVHWPDAEIWRYRDLLVAVSKQMEPDAAMDVAWDLRSPLDLPGVGRLQAVPRRGKGLAEARLKHVQVRLRQGGETLLLPGHRHHHALKKLLQAEGFSPWLRARLPLFYSDNGLAAVADRWVCAPYAAQADEPGLAIVWEPARFHAD